MSMERFAHRAYSKLVRTFKHVKFGHIGRHSGYDPSCCFEGAEHIWIGDGVSIGPRCQLIALDAHYDQQLNPSVIIGNNVHVTQALRLTCASRVEIGDDVLIAPNVFITDHNHGMNPMCASGYSRQPIEVANVSIEQGAWLGENVCVLSGVTIGEHSIVGAGAVVTRSIPSFAIAVGSPARVIKRWDFDRGEWKSTC